MQHALAPCCMEIYKLYFPPKTFLRQTRKKIMRRAKFGATQCTFLEVVRPTKLFETKILLTKYLQHKNFPIEVENLKDNFKGLMLSCSQFVGTKLVLQIKTRLCTHSHGVSSSFLIFIFQLHLMECNGS